MFDPRTTPIEEITAHDRPFAYWQGKKRTDGTQYLTEEFVDHAKKLYRKYSGGGEKYLMVDEENTEGLSGEDIAHYARHCLKERIRISNLPVMATFVDEFPELDGWVLAKHPGEYGDEFGHIGSCYGAKEDSIALMLFNEAEQVKLVFNCGPVTELNPYQEEGKKIQFSGHTVFKAKKSDSPENWYTLSRRGVDDSFYGGELTNILELVPKELAKALKSRGRIQNLITVPGTSWSIHPDDKQKITDKLKKGGSHHFAPAGFGTGNMYTKQRQSYSKRAAKVTETFFGAGVLYYTNTDCD